MIPVRLGEADDEKIFGGKAVQLAAALRAGLPVPDGFALPASLVEAVAHNDSSATQALADLMTSPGPPLAVRSSGVGEDSVEASFAGQHLTRLNVGSLPALIDAVKAVWKSAYSDAALAYRRRLGIQGEPRIGCVLQRLVPSRVAGVLFTVNPLTGADERIIEASWGLGEAIVAGLVTPDRYRVSRLGAVLERTAGDKDIMVRPLPEGGTTEVSVDPSLVHALCLADQDLARLHEVASRTEQCFGPSQDLEWGIASDELFLLQWRRVTRVLDRR